jgi:hypothetical protein
MPTPRRSAATSGAFSFKADRDLVALLKGVRNRSEFIRNAILAALGDTCPLCNGTGILQPRQRHDWDAFTRSHPVAECKRCHGRVFTCDGEPLTHDCPK